MKKSTFDPRYAPVTPGDIYSSKDIYGILGSAMGAKKHPPRLIKSMGDFYDEYGHPGCPILFSYVTPVYGYFQKDGYVTHKEKDMGLMRILDIDQSDSDEDEDVIVTEDGEFLKKDLFIAVPILSSPMNFVCRDNASPGDYCYQRGKNHKYYWIKGIEGNMAQVVSVLFQTTDIGDILKTFKEEQHDVNTLYKVLGHAPSEVIKTFEDGTQGMDAIVNIVLLPGTEIKPLEEEYFPRT